MQSNIFKYQVHFDGIRAIAVIFVLLYHLNKEIFTFGYVGVDIFFVISGYVITQTLIKQFYTNKDRDQRENDARENDILPTTHTTEETCHKVGSFQV